MKEQKTLQTISLILSIVAIVLSIVSTVLSISVKVEIAERTKVISTEEALQDYIDVKIGDISISEGSYRTEASLPVKITNKSSKTLTYVSVDIEALDSVEDVITTSSVYTKDNLEPNQSVTLEAFDYATSEEIEKLPTAKFQIKEVHVYDN